MEVGGREVAEAKGQRRPGEMVLIDPHTGSGGPMSASWFQFSVPIGGLVTCSTAQILSGNYTCVIGECRTFKLRTP